MSYTWTDGEVITAEKLNATGGGFLIVNDTYVEETDCNVLDKTWQEINDHCVNGGVAFVWVETTEGLEMRHVSKVHNNGGNYYVETGGFAYFTDSPSGYPSIC